MGFNQCLIRDIDIASVFSFMFCITIYQLCTYTKMLNYAWKLLFMVPAIININRPYRKNIFKATNKRTRTFF